MNFSQIRLKRQNAYKCNYLIIKYLSLSIHATTPFRYKYLPKNSLSLFTA